MSFDHETDSISSSLNQHFEIIERSNPEQQTCTLKSEVKGCVYIDPATKQRRYLSPLEQFLKEQDQLFSSSKCISLNSARSYKSSTASSMLETGTRASTGYNTTVTNSSEQQQMTFTSSLKGSTMINSAE